MKKFLIPSKAGLVAFLAGGLAATASDAAAADISMNQSDANGQASYSNGTHFVPAGTPTGGNDYFTLGFTMRTAGGGNGVQTFGGDSLTIGDGSTDPVNNARILYKGNPGGTLLINNLIANGGGVIAGWNTGNGNLTLDGGVTIESGGLTLAANSLGSQGIQVITRTITVASSLTGVGGLSVVNGETGLRGAVFLNSATSNYTGGTIVGSSTADAFITLEVGSASKLGSGGVVSILNTGALTFNSINNMDIAQSLWLDSGLSTSNLISLNYSGSMDIAALSFDGGSTFASAGTYGAFGSGATFQSDYFSGAGVLTVVPEPKVAGLMVAGAMIIFCSAKLRARGNAREGSRC